MCHRIQYLDDKLFCLSYLIFIEEVKHLNWHLFKKKTNCIRMKNRLCIKVRRFIISYSPLRYFVILTIIINQGGYKH